MEGEVRFVNAVEFGADMKGSFMSRSCGETVPMLELWTELLRSKAGLAGDEKAEAGAPPSKAVKSSKSKPG